MDSSMQTDLCHGLRACGLPKSATLELLNTYIRWYDNNGPEWTNERIKGIKQWYETYLAGDPVPVPYMKHTKSNLPVGVFGALFRTKNQAKVLAALSANSLFVEKQCISDRQKEKFLSGLEGDPQQTKELALELGDLPMMSFAHTIIRMGKRKAFEGKYRRFPDLFPVTLEDMTGTSIPISKGQFVRVDDQNRLECLRRALLESWRSIPYPVLDYLDRTDHLDWIPENYSDIGVSPRKRADANPIGAIGLIQEPCLKLRSVANPNRVAQALTKPLGLFWETAMRDFPTDCTFDQGAGVDWVMRKLADGVELAGSDLSSATDLLDLNQCLVLARSWSMDLIDPNDEESHDRYDLAVRYFTQLSRGKWTTPKRSGLGLVSWKQGQPLGLYPSFRLLAITNNCLGYLAAVHSGLKEPWDSFRVIGDDIIMDAQMEAEYCRLVEKIGGRINRSKTIKSNRVAEFAGRIITPNREMRKTYRFRDPGDEGFMSYVRDLGPQAVSLLKPRQRRQWDNFKFIPGIAYPGDWNPNSEGEPLEDRVAWAESTHLFDDTPDPDPVTVDNEQQLLRLTMEAAERENTSRQEILKDLPWEVDDGVQPSILSLNGKSTGDPRLKGGLTTLQRLENESRRSDFKRYTRKVTVPPLFSSTEGETIIPTLETSPKAPEAMPRGQAPAETEEISETAIQKDESWTGEPAKAPTDGKTGLVDPPRGSPAKGQRGVRDVSDLVIKTPDSGLESPHLPGW